MIELGPLIYQPKKSVKVVELSELYLRENEAIRSLISNVSWSYFSISKSIPQTSENLWSGHFFPYIESTEELQVSINLALMGLYKQAFSSLRCALEVGMLSVYYNINDDGHRAVKDWIASKDSHEANTPRAKKIWKILRSNTSIRKFDDKFKLRDDFEELGFLHNYVHTKGHRYSNCVGLKKSNYQTFESGVFDAWCESFTKVVLLLIKLHMLKYPITVVEFDWSTKVGIDNPFPVLDKHEIDRIKRLLTNDEFAEIKQCFSEDAQSQELFEYIRNLPDLREEEVEEQIIQLDKHTIESGLGFIEWEKNEISQMHLYDDDSRERVLRRIRILRNWAEDNDLMGES